MGKNIRILNNRENMTKNIRKKYKKPSVLKIS